MASENFGYTGIPVASSSNPAGRENCAPSSAWGAGSEAGSARRDVGRRQDGGSVIDRRNTGCVKRSKYIRNLEACSSILEGNIANIVVEIR